MIFGPGHRTQGISCTTQSKAQIYSTLFLGCKNFVGNGGAVLLSGDLQSGVISLCSFVKCYSLYDSGSIHSDCELIFKCSTISFSTANHSGSFTANLSNADLISMNNLKSYSLPMKLFTIESTISSINETGTDVVYQVSSIISHSSLLNLKFSMFENCTEGYGCSFTFYGTKNYVSYLNAIGIETTSNATYGLLLFGFGCQAEFENCSFSHSGHPKIVSYYRSNNEKITIKNCWFMSHYRTLDRCETSNIVFVTEMTFVPFQFSGSCLIPNKITCVVKNYDMRITTALIMLIVML